MSPHWQSTRAHDNNWSIVIKEGTRAYLKIYLIENVKVTGKVCQVDSHFEDVVETRSGPFEDRLQVVEGGSLARSG